MFSNVRIVVCSANNTDINILYCVAYIHFTLKFVVEWYVYCWHVGLFRQKQQPRYLHQSIQIRLLIVSNWLRYIRPLAYQYNIIISSSAFRRQPGHHNNGDILNVEEKDFTVQILFSTICYPVTTVVNLASG